MLKRFFKSLLDSNVANESQYNSFAFVNFFDLEVFNIAFCIAVIILVIYIFF